MPKISCVITTYKGAEYLARSIESVISQTYTDWELIVVDDNDQDTICRRQTEKVMKNYASNPKIIYIQHKENRNGAVARNTGILAATGEYICFLDDDDFYLKERFQKCLTVAESCDGVLTDVIICRSNRLLNYYEIYPVSDLTKELFLNSNYLGTGSNLFLRRNIVNQISGFDESFIRHQDVEFMIRYATVASIGILNEPLVVKNNDSTSNVPRYDNLLKVKEQLNEKFRSNISQMNQEEKDRFMINQYIDLRFSAMVYGEEINVEHCNVELQKYGYRVKAKEYIKKYLSRVNFINKTHDFILYYKTKSRCTESCIREIKKIFKKDKEDAA